MCATFGDHLKSDMVQVAHHGAVGCESDFYDTVAPTVLWWPVAYSAFESQAKLENKNKGGTSAVDYRLLYETPSVKYTYVSDTYCTTLTLGVNGPAYADIYDARTGYDIEYNGQQIRVKGELPSASESTPVDGPVDPEGPNEQLPGGTERN